MMGRDEQSLSGGIDLNELLPEYTPEYTTFPGTDRETTLIHEFGEQSHLDSTTRGAVYQGDSRELLKDFEGEIDLIVTSPPFGLRKQKEYGNEDPEEYIEWFLDFAKQAYNALADDGDFVVDIGGGWERGEPIRSTYHFELLVDLATDDGRMNKEFGDRFNLAQDFYWYNPAKLPTPAQWVTIERIRVKDAVNHVWWFSKDDARDRENGKPDNRAVLKPYSDSQKKLMENGYKDKLRPSGHDISDKFDDPLEDGAIRPNFWDVIEHSLDSWGVHDLLDLAGVSSELRRAAEKNDRLQELAEVALNEDVIDKIGELQGIDTNVESPVMEIANTRSRTQYLVGCDKYNIDAHPARFPRELPEFFVQFLTEPGDIVADIFGGSNMTGWVAQQYDRNWITFEMEQEYIDSSRFWFMNMDDIENEAKKRKETENTDDPTQDPETASDD